jgi:adenosine deaminase
VALGVYAEPADVPLRRIVEAGIPVALGADDPLLFGTRLAEQYASARALGFDDEGLAGLARGSLRGSRMPADRRAAALADVDAWLAGRPAGGPPAAVTPATAGTSA